VLRRNRYHNFTPKVMAHEYLAYRRLDRFFHRCTVRCDEGGNFTESGRPFLGLSLSGDLFLNGQVARVVGLFVALARGVIDNDFVDCVFDEKYPHLVATPPLPSFALYGSEVFYIAAEGKSKSILTARKTDRYSKGWNDEPTLRNVSNWRDSVRVHISREWMRSGLDPDGRLSAERIWAEDVLLPWAESAKKQLDEYRKWKLAQTRKLPDEVKNHACDCLASAENANMVPSCPHSIETIDPMIPPIYEKVLLYLRKADESGMWPSTTPKRQLVMVSNSVSSDGSDTSAAVGTSLSIEYLRANSRMVDKSCAYSFVEGEGGASGSFSVGAMPGDKTQPRANSQFPDLMKAAFELERELRPDREPSSTIAINRNAQFRPHTDSGAGAGQSTSLIVGLGTYTGGELVVEGDKTDIRYNPLEFNGWKQRHWTMPFQGERFSLVWFTPKGCEGVHGIDLCKS
jgi:hypothetical protein